MKNGLHIDQDGNHRWFLNDQLHRSNGPAYISEASKSWWQYGVRHREDGPAIMYTNGPINEWWLSGHRLSESDFKNQIIQLNLQSLL